MKYIHPITPSDPRSALVGVIKKHCAVSDDPVYVDVQVAGHAFIDECFQNVSTEVGQSGGQRVLGWTLWELPGIFFEAEFHAVWERPDGTLVDITPKKEPTSRILFLKVPDAVYAGRRVNNLRIPVSREPAVLEYLEACEAEFEFLNSGERSAQKGAITLSGIDSTHYMQIQQAKNQLSARFGHLLPQVGPYTPCVCGCGKKAKWCDMKRGRA